MAVNGRDCMGCHIQCPKSSAIKCIEQRQQDALRNDTFWSQAFAYTVKIHEHGIRKIEVTLSCKLELLYDCANTQSTSKASFLPFPFSLSFPSV